MAGNIDADGRKRQHRAPTLPSMVNLGKSFALPPTIEGVTMKPSSNGKSITGKALTAALDRMSFEYLSTNAPDLIVAIDQELQAGTEPEGIRFIVQRHVGPDREGLALRCEQAARYMAGQQVMA